MTRIAPHLGSDRRLLPIPSRQTLSSIALQLRGTSRTMSLLHRVGTAVLAGVVAFVVPTVLAYSSLTFNIIVGVITAVYFLIIDPLLARLWAMRPRLKSDIEDDPTIHGALEE